MFRCVNGAGLGNLFIWLSQIDDKTPVSSTIYNGYRGKYLDFTNLNIVDDDPSIESIKVPDIYINPYTIHYVHPNCKNKIKPSKLLEDIIQSHKHLVSDIDCAIAIRTYDPYAGKITDEHTLKYFEFVIKSCEKPVFVACDNFEYKLNLSKKYPGKVKFVNSDFVHINNNTEIDSPAPFLDFFLLSMSPFVYLTGGPKDMTKFSTFGYMACIYGNVNYTICWNQP